MQWPIFFFYSGIKTWLIVRSVCSCFFFQIFSNHLRFSFQESTIMGICYRFHWFLKFHWQPSSYSQCAIIAAHFKVQRIWFAFVLRIWIAFVNRSLNKICPEIFMIFEVKLKWFWLPQNRRWSKKSVVFRPGIVYGVWTNFLASGFVLTCSILKLIFTLLKFGIFSEWFAQSIHCLF